MTSFACPGYFGDPLSQRRHLVVMMEPREERSGSCVGNSVVFFERRGNAKRLLRPFVALVTIDPITCIEGHLKLQVDVSNGSVANAWSSGTLFQA